MIPEEGQVENSNDFSDGALALERSSVCTFELCRFTGGISCMH